MTLTKKTHYNVKKAYYNVKITEIEGKIPSITGLATTAAFNTVEK